MKDETFSFEGFILILWKYLKSLERRIYFETFYKKVIYTANDGYLFLYHLIYF